MTIDKSAEVLADYIDTYKICGGNGYNPATNITQEACEAFEMAIDTMHKYHKIADIIDNRYGISVSETLDEIIKVVDNGNDD